MGRENGSIWMEGWIGEDMRVDEEKDRYPVMFDWEYSRISSLPFSFTVCISFLSPRSLSLPCDFRPRPVKKNPAL